jgi:hypothetical protein
VIRSPIGVAGGEYVSRGSSKLADIVDGRGRIRGDPRPSEENVVDDGVGEGALKIRNRCLIEEFRVVVVVVVVVDAVTGVGGIEDVGGGRGDTVGMGGAGIDCNPGERGV